MAKKITSTRHLTHDPHWAVPQDIQLRFAALGANFQLQHTSVSTEGLQAFMGEIVLHADSGQPLVAIRAAAAFHEKTGVPAEDVLVLVNQILEVYREYIEREEPVH